MGSFKDYQVGANELGFSPIVTAWASGLQMDAPALPTVPGIQAWS